MRLMKWTSLFLPLLLIVSVACETGDTEEIPALSRGEALCVLSDAQVSFVVDGSLRMRGPAFLADAGDLTDEELLATWYDTWNKSDSKFRVAREAVLCALRDYQAVSDFSMLTFPDDQYRDCSAEDCSDWRWHRWRDDESVFWDTEWWWKNGRYNVPTHNCEVPDVQKEFGQDVGQYVSLMSQIRPNGDAPVGDALLSMFDYLFAVAGDPISVLDTPTGDETTIIDDTTGETIEYTEVNCHVDGSGQLLCANDPGYDPSLLSHHRTVVLVTDGEDTCNGDPVGMVKKLRSRNVDVIVFAFETSQNVEFLNELAVLGGHPREGDVKYHILRGCGDIVAALDTIVSYSVGEEICDGFDNDCDGEVDEALYRTCPVECGGGYQVCAYGAWSGCTPLEDQAQLMIDYPELCDGIDNNCDGDVDEGYLLGRSCMEYAGVCSAAGSTVCAADGQSVECSAQTPVIETEICDGIDNDCDGHVDEGLTEPCTNACGSGHRECVAGAFDECIIDNPNVEICDGIDNDCDGETDEGFGVGDACTVGTEICFTTGMMACTADGLGSECDIGGVQLGSPEVCNGSDDDCDGLIDEGDICPPGQVCFDGVCVFD